MALIDPPGALDQRFNVSDVCLGTGSFGTVLLGFDTFTGRQVAVKELPVQTTAQGVPSDFPEAVTNEIAIMKHANHPRLVKYFGARMATSKVSGLPVVQIIMEYVPAGTLGSLLRRVGQLRESVAASFVLDILQGLEHLHSKCASSHRDLKPENVLVTADGHCKLSDFGASKAILERGSSTHATGFMTCVGTPPYMAPEVARGDPYGRAADVWSVGCIVVHMLTGSPPLYGLSAQANPLAIMYRVASDDDAVLALPSTCLASDAARNFVAICGRRDAGQRATATALLKHSWLATAAVSDEAADDAPRLPLNVTVTASPAAPASDGGHGDEDDDEAMFSSSTDSMHAHTGVPHCEVCDVGIALFSCDACRRQGLAGTLCPTCWDKIHRPSQIRGALHRKAPLLMATHSAEADDGTFLFANGVFVDVPPRPPPAPIS